MLSARSLCQEILDHDESLRPFCSIAASGESQGGWENHGRIFHALLKKRGLTPVAVPPETDYTMLLERHGVGLAHDKLRRYFGDHPEVGKAVRMISDDEDNHLACTHEELLRFAAGHGRLIQRSLRACALAETRVHRDVSLAVMAHMGRILGWPKAKSVVLSAGIHVVYGYERLVGRRRMPVLRLTERRDALGGPAAPAHEFA
ncbi:hypothetical protein AV521_07075 [Streptomyces sp. IMTB 2501]|uniref:hypothetical protein n=1 Tax=Streptomyces sp. IMTB 2501 TaxID=1776340 RepID=UPI00096E3817|nr:hypothetical protein [Streptomyces sp. IMTB 2501]OLZ72974.1 hypothetical protein AV521_07075 [Streptomyces sp. IMTB 2501]